MENSFKKTEVSKRRKWNNVHKQTVFTPLNIFACWNLKTWPMHVYHIERQTQQPASGSCTTFVPSSYFSIAEVKQSLLEVKCKGCQFQEGRAAARMPANRLQPHSAPCPAPASQQSCGGHHHWKHRNSSPCPSSACFTLLAATRAKRPSNNFCSGNSHWNARAQICSKTSWWNLHRHAVVVFIPAYIQITICLSAYMKWWRMKRIWSFKKKTKNNLLLKFNSKKFPTSWAILQSDWIMLSCTDLMTLLGTKTTQYVIMCLQKITELEI